MGVAALQLRAPRIETVLILLDHDFSISTVVFRAMQLVWRSPGVKIACLVFPNEMLDALGYRPETSRWLHTRSVECGKHARIPEGNSSQADAGRIVDRVRHCRQ